MLDAGVNFILFYKFSTGCDGREVVWCAGTQSRRVSCQITMHQLYSELSDGPSKTFATNFTETLLKSLNSKCFVEISFYCTLFYFY